MSIRPKPKISLAISGKRTNRRLTSIFLSTDFDVKVFTVASEETEGYVRYIRSANYYEIDITTLGLNQEWRGGKMESIGGGYKVNLLRQALEPFRDDNKKIVLFTDR